MSGTSGIRYRERRVGPALRPFVECVWIAFDMKRRSSRPPEHIVPDACPELIVHLGDVFARRIGRRWVRQPRVFLAGTLSRPWTLRAGPRVETLGIRFRPGAVIVFFPMHMKEIVDREVGLAKMIGVAESRELVCRVGAARGTEARFSALERWLLERLKPTDARRGEVTGPAVDAILCARGQKRIDAVSASLGVSRRRLERAFARDLGIRPKLFARIVRLNAALATLGAAERTQAIDVAIDAGYFDQAHLARDFRAVAGRRSGARRDDDGEMSRHFTDPARLLAFLAGE